MLLIHINGSQKREQILSLAKRLNHETRTFSAAEYDLTLASLLNGDKPKSKPKLPPLYIMPDIIIFSGLRDKELDRFLDEYKKAEIAPTPLKAVVTPFNLNFKIGELTEHLKAEASAVRG